MEVKEIQKYLMDFEPSRLRDIQKRALEEGVLDGKSLLVCSPTGSGKTMVAEFGMIRNFLLKKGQAVYVVPLKSLASEKYREFKGKYERYGIKVGIFTGELDSSSEFISKYDVCIVTVEKLDSLIRHGYDVNRVSLLVIDEVHLLGDSARGATLEFVISIFKYLGAKPQIISLSATIGNPEEVAEWLLCKLIYSEERPTRLYQGVLQEGELDFFGERENKVLDGEENDEDLVSLAIDTYKIGKQALFFCSTKKNAEALCERISKEFRKLGVGGEELGNISKRVLRALEIPSEQCRRLSLCVNYGVSFHHAGLMSKQREEVERGFREGKIKIICCTPTLAMGVNLPAFRSVVCSLKRYSERWGSDYIPIREYHQMTGRAGRPGMEEFGEAISIAKGSKEKEIIFNKYINGPLEKIESSLSSKPALRMFCLSLVSLDICKNREELNKFFEGTFFGFIWGVRDIKYIIDEVLEENINYGFIVEEPDRLVATRLGKRVSQLYIDPLTAHEFIINLDRVSSAFGILFVVCSAAELPPLRVGQKDLVLIDKFMNEKGELLPYRADPWAVEYEYYLRGVKTALLFSDWISEVRENIIDEKFGIRPGEMRNLLLNADWLLYGLAEIAKLTNHEKLVSEINKVRIRMENGIREELVRLVMLKGIGRVRARRLYSAGIRDTKELKEFDLKRLAVLIGINTAISVKRQVGIELGEEEVRTLRQKRGGQGRLDGV